MLCNRPFASLGISVRALYFLYQRVLSSKALTPKNKDATIYVLFHISKMAVSIIVC